MTSKEIRALIILSFSLGPSIILCIGAFILRLSDKLEAATTLAITGIIGMFFGVIVMMVASEIYND